MKLQFKHQKFQADAAKAVVDVFAGQPYLTTNYRIDNGSGIYQTDMETSFTGWRNEQIVPELNDSIILEHLQKIQRTNQIEPSKQLEGHYMVAALSAHHYEINGGKIAFSEANCANLPTLQKKLSFLLDVKKTLDAVHVTADLDCSSLSVTDNTNLSILRAALIDKEPIKMCSSQSLLRSCHIANLELLLWVVPTEENSEYHNIYDFNYVPLIYREFDKNDKEYPSTHFVMLNKDAMLKYCNIDYNALLDAVQHVPFSKDYSHSLNALLLEMLKAYDESKNSRIELLSTATTLALWIKDSDPYTEHPIAILNYLQSVKRSRILTSTEQAEILSLIEVAQDNESIYVGAYLLLDNPVAAKIHFDKLPEESQKFFESCPIYHFMPNGQPTISAPTEG